MALTRTRYEADNGDVHPIRISSEKASVAGTPPAGNVSNNISASVNKTKRRQGLRPRGVRLARTVGSVPNQAQRYAFIPCLTPARFAALTIDSELEYDGNDWTIIDKVAEDAD